MPKNTKDENRTTTNENDKKRIPRKMTLEQNKNDVEKNGNFPNRQGESCPDLHATSTLWVKEYVGRLLWRKIRAVMKV
jgi:hypothetical protein